MDSKNNQIARMDWMLKQTMNNFIEGKKAIYSPQNLMEVTSNNPAHQYKKQSHAKNKSLLNDHLFTVQ